MSSPSAAPCWSRAANVRRQVHFALQFADRIVGLSQGKVAIDTATAEFDREAANRLYGAPAARAGLES